MIPISATGNKSVSSIISEVSGKLGINTSSLSDLLTIKSVKKSELSRNMSGSRNKTTEH